MCESRWTYYDPEGGTQTLGLYHGHDSGNVVIYHNHQVVIVDFQIHKPKSYSFMVNQNLVKIDVLKENGKYDYQFETRNVMQHREPSIGKKVMSFFRRSFSYG